MNGWIWIGDKRTIIVKHQHFNVFYNFVIWINFSIKILWKTQCFVANRVFGTIHWANNDIQIYYLIIHFFNIDCTYIFHMSRVVCYVMYVWDNNNTRYEHNAFCPNVYVYIYDVCTCTHTCDCTMACVCTRAFVQVPVHAQISAFIQIPVFVQVFVCVCVQVPAFLQLFVPAHIHVLVSVHVQEQVREPITILQ